MTTNDRVRLAVRRLLMERGMRQKQAAEYLGIATASMSQKLSGRRNFSLAEVGLLAELLQVPLAALVGEAGAESSTSSPLDDPAVRDQLAAMVQEQMIQERQQMAASLGAAVADALAPRNPVDGLLPPDPLAVTPRELVAA